MENKRPRNIRGSSGTGEFKNSRSGFKRNSSGSKGVFTKKPFKHNSKFRSKNIGRKRKGGKKMTTFDPSLFINKNPVEEKTEVFVAKNNFKDFLLEKSILEKLKTMGINTPSPIQDKIIPEILKGSDVVGLAETGTGKTAAFLLPIIQKTIHDKHSQALILAPTRELAIQIDDEFKKISTGQKQFSTVCVGGVPIFPQIRSLRRINHFIIGTPGRIMDLIERKSIDPSRINTVVLDEADRMLDMGFVGDMRKILGQIPKERQTLLFSATMTKGAELIVNDFLQNPVNISVKKKETTNSIFQDVVPYDRMNKFETLKNMLVKEEFKKVIIFGSMKHSVEELSRQLNKNGIKSDSIHGNKNHRQRQGALKRFKAGEVSVLVATDVAARGIHVDNISHVINYDLPQQLEDYVHRIGRTGRVDKKGIALTFVSNSPSHSKPKPSFYSNKGGKKDFSYRKRTFKR